MFLLLQLVPGKHYVPFKSDLSDLSDQLEWIRANDEIASKIIFRAKKFSNQNLLPQNVLCYHAVFLKKWTSRLKPKFIISRMFLDWKDFKFRSHETIMCSRLKLFRFIVCFVYLNNIFCLEPFNNLVILIFRSGWKIGMSSSDLKWWSWRKNLNIRISKTNVLVHKTKTKKSFNNKCQFKTITLETVTNPLNRKIFNSFE